MAEPEAFDFGIGFKQYFEVVPAFSPELKDEVYRIRHQVYCIELGYEAPRPDFRESDQYDPESLHLLMRSIKTGAFIGCTRIVRGRASDPTYVLPFESLCEAALDRSIVDPSKLPRDKIAEVSRLAVVGEFRRRKSDTKEALSLSDADFGTEAQPRFPYIPLGLYLGTVELARLSGIDTLFVLTEPRLASHFRKLGVNIETVGAPVEHRGQRIPSMMSTHGIVDNLKALFRSLYRTIAADVARGMPEHPHT